MSFNLNKRISDDSDKIRLPGYTSAHLGVLRTLADMINDKKGYCWPSVTTIASKSWLSERHTRTVLRALEADGLIAVSSHTGTSNRYRITLNRDDLQSELQCEEDDENAHSIVDFDPALDYPPSAMNTIDVWVSDYNYRHSQGIETEKTAYAIDDSNAIPDRNYRHSYRVGGDIGAESRSPQLIQPPTPPLEVLHPGSDRPQTSNLNQSQKPINESVGLINSLDSSNEGFKDENNSKDLATKIIRFAVPNYSLSAPASEINKIAPLLGQYKLEELHFLFEFAEKDKYWSVKIKEATFPCAMFAKSINTIATQYVNSKRKADSAHEKGESERENNENSLLS